MLLMFWWIESANFSTGKGRHKKRMSKEPIDIHVAYVALYVAYVDYVTLYVALYVGLYVVLLTISVLFAVRHAA